MKKLATAVLLASGLAAAHASVITFDDLWITSQGTDDTRRIPEGYADLDWFNFFVVRATDFPDLGYGHGIVSTPNVAFNAYGDEATIAATSSAGFDLASGDFTAATVPLVTVTARATFEDGRLASTTFTTVFSGPRHEVFDWVGLASVTFDSGNLEGDQFALDNLSTSAPAPIPEPEGRGLLLAGLALAGLASRRHRRRLS
jgi:hypothetical protein